MAMTKTKKKEIIEKITTKPNDPGSAAAQIALLTERVQYLSKHLTNNPKDFSSKRGLSVLISKRKKLISYLEKTNKEEYHRVLKHLGLRK